MASATIQPSIMETIWAQEQEKRAKDNQTTMDWESLSASEQQEQPKQSFISSKVGHILSTIRKRRGPGSTTVKIIRRTKHTPPRNAKHSKHSKATTSNSVIPVTPSAHPAPNPIPSNDGNDYKTSLFAVLPHIISGYLQLLLNILIISASIFLLYKFWIVLQHDIDLRAESYAIDIDQENTLCSKEYANNKCDARVPALEEKCIEWDKCRQRDPTDLARARISAETIADTINHLIEPISYKTMIFFFVLFSSFMLVTNLGLRFGKVAPSSQPQLFNPYFSPLLAQPHTSTTMQTTPSWQPSLGWQTPPRAKSQISSPYKPFVDL